MRLPAAFIILFVALPVAGEMRGAVQLRFVTEAGTAARVTGTLRISDAGALDNAAELERRELAEASGAIVSSPPGSKRRITLDSETWWMAPVSIDIARDGVVRQDVVVWNATTLRGTFAAKENLPDSFEIFVESPPHPSQPSLIPRNTTLICPLVSSGEWSCRVPAATLDLALRVPGFAPIYRWQTVIASQGRDLGRMSLRKGASVTAWIDRKISGSPGVAARAELYVLAVDDASATTARLRRPVASASFDRSGQVQLTGLEPGLFILRVTASGFAEMNVFPVTVYEGRETAIRKVLELQRPFTLELTLLPPADSGGLPWDVEVRRANDHGSGYAPEATRLRTDATGAIHLAEQSPGRYKVVVRDRTHNKVFNEDLAFGGAAPERQTIRIDAHVMSGTLSIGGQPVAASMWFGGKSGAVQVRTRSNADGRFSVRLPHRDRWLVEIEEGDLHAIRDVMWAEELEIDLPDAVVRGVVTRSDGTPVPGAEVRVSAEGTAVMRLADEDGHFSIRGVSGGSAQARDRRTDEYSRFVKIEPERDLTLVIEESREIDGVVVAEGTPVIGARVGVYGLIGRSGNQSSAVTDAEGRFRVQVPLAATSIVAVVGAPGRVFEIFAVNGERPPVLNIHRAGGNLSLLLPEDLAKINVWSGAVWFPFTDLVAWALGFGGGWDNGVMRVPNLAPGEYRFCGDLEDGRTRCRSTVITAHGMHEVDLRQ